MIYNFNWRYLSTPGDTNTDTVGWLADKTATTSPYARMTAMIPGLVARGYTALQLPPSTKGASGPFSGGYDLLDPYDVGSKDQAGAIATAFGTAEELRRLVAVAHRYGADVYIDLVLHQYDGTQADGTYNPPGSGAPGRWPKHNLCFAKQADFVGGVTPDTVPNEEGNFGFGLMPSYQNAQPPGYMWEGAKANAEWLVATLGTDGMRVDDAKGTNADIVLAITTLPSLADQFVFWEYYDGDLDAIRAYCESQNWRGSALDFAAKFNLGNIADNNSREWMGQIANIGWCLEAAGNAITWAESADTDTSPGEQTIYNKMLVYAIIMTLPGYPMTYSRDDLAELECYGLGPLIDNVVFIHERLAQGEFVVRDSSDYQVFAFERLGYGPAPGCVVLANNDQYATHTVTVATRYPGNTRLHEYTGNGGYSDDHWTAEDGSLTVTIPKNDNGMSYLVFALPGIAGGFALPARETNQTFFGAPDLDIGPLVNGTRLVGIVSAEAGTFFSTTVSIDDDVRAEWGNSVEITVHVTDAEGFLWLMAYDDQGPVEQGATTKAKLSGWHTVSIVASGLPDAGSAFALRTTYTGA